MTPILMTPSVYSACAVPIPMQIAATGNRLVPLNLMTCSFPARTASCEQRSYTVWRPGPVQHASRTAATSVPTHGTLTNTDNAPGALVSPASPRAGLLCLHQRAFTLIDRAEGFGRGDRGTQFVVVPRRLALLRFLDLEQIHVLDLASILPDQAFPEQFVVGRH